MESLEDRTLLDFGLTAALNLLTSTQPNLARGRTPFAKDVIPGYPDLHAEANLNDGQYGNSPSWTFAVFPERASRPQRRRSV